MEKTEDVVQEWLLLKAGALAAGWKLLRVLVCGVGDVLGVQGALTQSWAQLSIRMSNYSPPPRRLQFRQ